MEKLHKNNNNNGSVEKKLGGEKQVTQEYTCFAIPLPPPLFTLSGE